MGFLHFTLGTASGLACSYLVLDQITTRRLLAYRQPINNANEAHSAKYHRKLQTLMLQEEKSKYTKDETVERLRRLNNEVLLQTRSALTRIAVEVKKLLGY